jgi:hypothetical protein
MNANQKQGLAGLMICCAIHRIRLLLKCLLSECRDSSRRCVELDRTKEKPWHYMERQGQSGV